MRNWQPTMKPDGLWQAHGKGTEGIMSEDGSEMLNDGGVGGPGRPCFQAGGGAQGEAAGFNDGLFENRLAKKTRHAGAQP